MAFTINLGNWGSVFAVPSKVADEKLKLSSAYQLRVLLYVLGHNNMNFTNEEIGKALAMHEEDVKDALTYWVQEGILAFKDDVYTPSDVPVENNSRKEISTPTVQVKEEKPVIKEKVVEQVAEIPQRTVMPRPQKPNHTQIAMMVAKDKTLVDLLNEVQMILGKTMSNSDTATIVYLYDTCGLPAPVILMVVQYCMVINKPNLRTIERIGVQWADEGISTVLEADAKIQEATQSTVAFKRVASVFGIHIAGNPSQKQLSYANKWVEDWKFSDEMLLEAYERCLDAKGEMKFSYIDGILKRWYNDGIKNISEIENKSVQKPRKVVTKQQPSASKLQQKPSYNIEELENDSYFD